MILCAKHIFSNLYRSSSSSVFLYDNYESKDTIHSSKWKVIDSLRFHAQITVKTQKIDYPNFLISSRTSSSSSLVFSLSSSESDSSHNFFKIKNSLFLAIQDSCVLPCVSRILHNLGICLCRFIFRHNNHLWR